MDPIREEFRQTLSTFPVDAPVEAPVEALVQKLQTQKKPLEDASQFTDNELDLSDVKLKMNASRKSGLSRARSRRSKKSRFKDWTY